MSAGEFADGLTSWWRGEESEEAEAAAIVLAETILLHRKWILAQRAEKD